MGEGIAFWIIQIPGWSLFIYLLVTQCTAALSYELGVRMGTQEPVERVTQVGVAFLWGFALADLVFYVPILGLGLFAHWTGSTWAAPTLGAALGITIYWPIAVLATVSKARSAPGWNLPNERGWWILCPLIAVWALIALLVLMN